ncbi:MAG: hypothetical protein ACSHXY_00520 [Alphaproteobacteria bacterium]
MPSFKSTHEAADTAINDTRHKLIEEGWFGQQTTGDHSSIKPGAYELPYATTEAASIETTPSIEVGETEYDRVWGAEPSREALYGEASTSLSVAHDVEPPSQEPEIEYEPEP